MSTVLFNPTNEDFDNMMWGGKGMPLKSGQKMTVDDACARHLLNGYTGRGLCVLEFSEDPDYLPKVKEDGIKRNLAFKRKMVMDHNHRNVLRKQQGQSYIEPTPEIRRYAEELGLTLDEPYALKDKENERLIILEHENRQLKEKLDDLMMKMGQFLTMQTAQMEAGKVPKTQATGK